MPDYHNNRGQEQLYRSMRRGSDLTVAPITMATRVLCSGVLDIMLAT